MHRRHAQAVIAAHRGRVQQLKEDAEANLSRALSEKDVQHGEFIDSLREQMAADSAQDAKVVGYYTQVDNERLFSELQIMQTKFEHVFWRHVSTSSASKVQKRLRLLLHYWRFQVQRVIRHRMCAETEAVVRELNKYRVPAKFHSAAALIQSRYKQHKSSQAFRKIRIAHQQQLQLQKSKLHDTETAHQQQMSNLQVSYESKLSKEIQQTENVFQDLVDAARQDIKTTVHKQHAAGLIQKHFRESRARKHMMELARAYKSCVADTVAARQTE
eukprot:SAG31_NODE_4370_length_3304_cov_2.644618_3_plen_271_part_01